MTTIKALCPSCGEVELTPDDIDLRVCTRSTASYYLFECPSCGDTVQKPADDRVVRLLLSGGVAATVWDLPAEMEEARTGPPLTLDDLLDLHLALGSDDWFDRLNRAGSASA